MVARFELGWPRWLSQVFIALLVAGSLIIVVTAPLLGGNLAYEESIGWRSERESSAMLTRIGHDEWGFVRGRAPSYRFRLKWR